jgi:hypothetical protein
LKQVREWHGQAYDAVVLAGDVPEMVSGAAVAYREVHASDIELVTTTQYIAFILKGQPTRRIVPNGAIHLKVQ